MPLAFGGKAGEDVDEWLTNYRNVSRSNRWDSAAQLSNLVFSLAHTAVVWYENHEDTLTSWELLVQDLRSCFGDSSAKKKRAKQMLSQRAQVPGETCTTYIKEVLNLCKIVNSRRSEDDKVGHLLTE